VALYLSEDPAITMSDTRLATRFLWFLDPGASSTVVTPGVVPTSMEPGLYYLGAVADFSGLQPEPNESNNALAGAQIDVYRAADLVIAEASASTTRVNIGETLIITNTVRNQGTTYASNVYVEVALYLSPDATITTTDRALGSRYCASLGAGGASTAITTVAIPASVEPGRYYVGAVADPSDAHQETDEANNGFAGTVIDVVRDVDLRMIALSVASTRVSRGGSLEVTSAVENAGVTVTSAPYLQIGLYLSADADITTADRAIGWRTVASLAAAASSTGVVSVLVPADVAPGGYYLGGIADSYAQQPESDETNNAILGPPIEIE
jgi:subtilase family serine protease